jgi:hypothetical protein
MRAPSIRTRRIITLSSAPVAVVLAGLMVWQGTNAAFSADTRNIGNSWETGSVAISDDDAGGAMFQIQNVVPGQIGSKCIRVTATSSVPGLVKLYSADLAADGLQDYVKITVVQGTGGSFADCTSFVAGATEASQSLTSLAATHSSYDTGILPWVTAGVTSGESKTYKFSWVFDVGAMDQAGIDALQGKATSINLEWELQNSAP